MTEPSTETSPPDSNSNEIQKTFAKYGISVDLDIAKVDPPEGITKALEQVENIVTLSTKQLSTFSNQIEKMQTAFESSLKTVIVACARLDDFEQFYRLYKEKQSTQPQLFDWQSLLATSLSDQSMGKVAYFCISKGAKPDPKLLPLVIRLSSPEHHTKLLHPRSSTTNSHSSSKENISPLLNSNSDTSFGSLPPPEPVLKAQLPSAPGWKRKYLEPWFSHLSPTPNDLTFLLSTCAAYDNSEALSLLWQHVTLTTLISTLDTKNPAIQQTIYSLAPKLPLIPLLGHFIIHGAVKCIQFMILQGFNIGKTNFLSFSIFHYFVFISSWQPSHFQMLDLLKQHYNIDIPDDEGRTPFLFAVWHISTSSSTSTSPNEIELDPLTRYADWLLTNGANSKACDAKGHNVALRSILAHNHSALKYCISKDLLPICQTPEKQNLLHILSATADPFELSSLQQEGSPKIDFSKDSTILSIAIRLSNYNSVSTLIKLGANINGQDPQVQRTALHWAAALDNEEMVRILIQSKADKTLKDYGGKIPLNLANSAAVKTLLQG